MSIDEDRTARSLPDLDVRVIEHLRCDGRMTITDLAHALGVARATAQSALDRLVRARTVRVVGLVDPRLLGRTLVALMEISVDRHRDRVSVALAALPDVHFVARLTDPARILAQASVVSNEALLDLLNNSVRPIPGVAGVSTDIALRIRQSAAVTDRTGASGAWATGTPTGFTPDAVDLAVIGLLRTDGRATFAEIGRIAGLSTPAARQRVLKLIGSGIVRIRTLVDPDALGHTARGQVLLTVDGDTAAVADRAALLPFATYIVETAGRCDLNVEIHCTGTEQLDDAVVALEGLDGVTSVRLLRYEALEPTDEVWA